MMALDLCFQKQKKSEFFATYIYIFEHSKVQKFEIVEISHYTSSTVKTSFHLRYHKR
jgi:hypothetical protein